MVLVGSSQVLELFFLMCFGFWLEITGEKRQICKNSRWVPVLKDEYRYSKLFFFFV